MPKKKKYQEMNLGELRAATAQYESEVPETELRPLNPSEQKRWADLKRKRGRPTTGRGVKVVSVSLEQGLLERTDRLAKKLKISRAKLISAGLEKMLASAR